MIISRCKQAEQLNKLTKDKAELKRALAAAEGKEIEESSEALEAFAVKIRKNVGSAIEAQMVLSQLPFRRQQLYAIQMPYEKVCLRAQRSSATAAGLQVYRRQANKSRVSTALPNLTLAQVSTMSRHLLGVLV